MLETCRKISYAGSPNNRRIE